MMTGIAANGSEGSRVRRRGTTGHLPCAARFCCALIVLGVAASSLHEKSPFRWPVISFAQETDQQTQKDPKELAYAVSITTAKPTYRLMEPMVVMLDVTNHREDRLIFSTSDRFNRYRYLMLDADGQHVRRTHYGSPNKDGSGSFKKIPSGQSYRDVVPLSRGFDLSLPGKYRLRIGISLAGEAGDHPGLVWSNELELTVAHELVPPAEGKTKVTSTGELHDGYQAKLALGGGGFRPMQPIDWKLEVTNVSGEPFGRPGEKPIDYECDLSYVYPTGRRKVELSRFGTSRAVCQHVVDRAVLRGHSHQDHVLLNQFYDLSAEGEYELQVTAKLGGNESTSEGAKVTVGPVKFAVKGKDWVP